VPPQQSLEAPPSKASAGTGGAKARPTANEISGEIVLVLERI
jgi:hypothetical protein